MNTIIRKLIHRFATFTKNSIDITLYEIRKFVKLAVGMNPNIAELLFVQSRHLLFDSKEFQEILKIKKHFISERLTQTFLGYARSQFKKGIFKANTYSNLKKFNSYLTFLISLGKEKTYLADFSIDKYP